LGGYNSYTKQKKLLTSENIYDILFINPKYKKLTRSKMGQIFDMQNPPGTRFCGGCGKKL
jgi:hypothetical protein